jgi:hypothetical protein
MDHVKDFFLFHATQLVKKKHGKLFFSKVKKNFSIDFWCYLFFPSHGFNGARTFASAPAIPERENRIPCWPRNFLVLVLVNFYLITLIISSLNWKFFRIFCFNFKGWI